LATLPSQRTWVVGETVTAAYMNSNVRDTGNFFLNAPSARVFNSATLSIANGVSTAITFNSERWDNDGIHSTSSNTGRLTCVTAGVYDIGVALGWAANTAGVRIVRLRLNGGATYVGIDDRNATSSGNSECAFSVPWKLAAADFVEVEVFQNSGGALNVSASAEFFMSWRSAG
jgi:hypothetical protein